MVTNKIKRSQIKTFLNTGTPSTPVWALLATGIQEATINYNPSISEQTYIDEDNATITVEMYSPVVPIEAIAINTDAVFEYIDLLRIDRDILDDAETEIVHVWLYEDVTLGYYIAEKQEVSIQTDSIGGPGGESAKIGFTMNARGDPVAGQFNPSTLDFVPQPVLAGLTSLVFSISTLTLTPVFDGDLLFYTAPTTDATNVITAVADDGSAVITIDVDAVPVPNGDPATWFAGLNIVTVEVVVGSETVNYIAHVTKS